MSFAYFAFYKMKEMDALAGQIAAQLKR